MTAPFDTYFGLSQRSLNLMELFRHNQPEVLSYRLWGHQTINGAYGNPLDSGVGGAGPAVLANVNRGGFFRTPRLIRKGLGMFESNRRGQTTVVLDPDDFVGVGAAQPLGLDTDWLFMRTQEQRNSGLLFYQGVPEATITLVAVVATDRITIGGLIFEFAAGANALGGTVGSGGNPFIVGLGAGDAAAAANLVIALNDNGDVSPAYDAVAPLLLHTFAPAAVGAVVTVQPEDGTPTLVSGSLGAYTISTPDAPRVVIDAAALAAGALVAATDAANPVTGPIYCVPPAIFFGMPDPAVSFQATAPSNTGAVAGTAPVYNEDLAVAQPRPMSIVFPRPLTAITVHNLSGSNLLVAFGAGAPFMNLATLTETSLFSGRTKEIVVACPDAGGAVFRINGVCGLG